MISRVRLLAVFCLVVAAVQSVEAQVRVDLEIPRRLYMIYEPLVVTASITNLSGDRMVLRDEPGRPWLAFEIERTDGMRARANSMEYSLEPLVLEAGETARRSINLTPLYAMHDYGTYRIRMNVHVSDVNRYFNSPTRQVDITDGRKLWEQMVGVPGTSQMRRVSLLSHMHPKGNRLYVRISDEGEGVVYATTNVGRLLTFGQPKVEFDANNDIHILHMTSPRTFTYTYMTLDGEVAARSTYRSTERHPRLTKTEAGLIEVRGGILDEPVPVPADAPPTPRISDRPPGAPGGM